MSRSFVASSFVKLAASVAVMTAAVMVSSSALAQAKGAAAAPAAAGGAPAAAAGGAGAGKEEGYGYTFTDDPLSAGGFGPNDATIRVRPNAVRNTLIRPRTSFVPEMLKSVENL
jgi:uncharacterized membrane protein